MLEMVALVVLALAKVVCPTTVKAPESVDKPEMFSTVAEVVARYV